MSVLRFHRLAGGLVGSAIGAGLWFGALAPTSAQQPAAASPPHAAAPTTARAATRKTRVRDGLPRTAEGHPDFSGIWQTLSSADDDLEPHTARRDAPPGAGVVEGGAIPYLPAALDQKQKNFAARETADPRRRGWSLSVPRGIYYPEPFQIFQRPRDLTLVHQFGHSVRTIHTNGTDHPGVGDFWLGDSRGHWEGDTLVVSVKEFNDATWLDSAGNFHSDQLAVTERWRFIDANTIDYHATLEDPKVFSRPWTLGVLLYRHREQNFQLIEDYRYTLDYDAFYPPHKD